MSSEKNTSTDAHATGIKKWTYRKRPLQWFARYDKLLLTVLHEMPSGGVLQTIDAIEETFPGTIASAEDAFGCNALWFALRLFVHRGNADAASAVGEYLVSHGCDPDKTFGDTGKRRFSWNTMARIVSAIERYEQSLPADERGVIVGI